MVSIIIIELVFRDIDSNIYVISMGIQYYTSWDGQFGYAYDHRNFSKYTPIQLGFNDTLPIHAND